MKYKNLGESGLEISVISLGSWLTYGTSIEEGIAYKCLEKAISCGVNFIDTADVYNNGGAEKVIGNFLKGIDRSHIVIGTKVFFPMSQARMDKGLSLRHIRNSIRRSLDRLKTDYIDLYQCHRYDTQTPLEETCFAMQQLITEGLILYWGVSQWSGVQITNALRICEKYNWRKPIANQPIYNMLNRSLEVEVMEVCEAEKIGLIVYSPLAQGILTGKYKKEAPLPEDSRAAREASSKWFAFKRLTPENLDKIDALQKLAQELDCSMPQLALAWCLRYKPITSVIMGASKVEQIEENIQAATLEIPDEALQKIENLLGNRPIDQYTGEAIGYKAVK
jgi:voltage-dependent potassium channel beta subunit